MTATYDFITDRLAIGDVASRSTPGFCAVVSLLSSAPERLAKALGVDAGWLAYGESPS